MTVNEVFSLLEREVAPVSLSREQCELSGFHDNSGIILNFGGNVTGILFCLDLTPAAAEKAAASGFNLIVTHHPAIFGGIMSLSDAPSSPTRALAMCARGGISVISMHLNFDAAPRGIDFWLMCGLGGKTPVAVLNKLSCGEYGRVYEVSAQSFEEYSNSVLAEFKSPHCRFYDGGRTVRRVASFCGSGADEESIKFALENNADTFVSADIKHHHIAALISAGFNVIELTHYASEIYGFERIYASIKPLLKLPSDFFIQQILL